MATQSTQKIFNRHMLLLKADALQYITDLLSRFPEDDPAAIVDELARGLTEHDECPTGVVDAAAVARVYERLQVGNADAEMGEAMSDVALKVVNAFSMPRLCFDPERKAFQRSTLAPTVMGAADSKAQHLRDRYNVLKQVILRSEHFSPPALPGHDRSQYLQLTAIKNMLGRAGTRFLVFGMLTRNPEGDYCIEDPDDRVVLDTTDATPSVGLFTEGAFMMVDGVYQNDGKFKVTDIAHPPPESRTTARSIHGHIDFLGIGALTLTDEVLRAQHLAIHVDVWQERYRELEVRHAGTMIVISDVYLDQPKVLDALRTILQGYVVAGVTPAAIVLCGNFSSTPFLFDGSSTASYTASFATLAGLLNGFPSILQDSHVILVPGPTDPWSSDSLPRPPLPSAMTKALQKVPHVIFASNPCRIQYLSQEVVIFREDLMSRMLRNCVLIKDESERREEEQKRRDDQDRALAAERRRGVPEDELTAPTRTTLLEEYLVQTILDQAHLVPLPPTVRPIIWEYDHALRLYPMPTTLVIADKYSPYELTYEMGESSCLVFNPGSFVANGFGWTTYQTATRKAEQSELS